MLVGNNSSFYTLMFNIEKRLLGIELFKLFENHLLLRFELWNTLVRDWKKIIKHCLEGIFS